MTHQIRPFDQQAASYTLRELHIPYTEFKSIYPNAEAAALGFLRACNEAQSAELRDPSGTVIAAFARGVAA